MERVATTQMRPCRLRTPEATGLAGLVKWSL